MGLNGLYVNRRGREAWGIVDSGAEADGLMDELEQKLLALTDHATGLRAIAKLYRATRIYHGPYVAESPDFLVGYARTYRSSDKSALGSLTRPVIQDRLDTWSGDHLMETEAVPGVILANRKLAGGSRGLTDIAPTILEAFGIAKPEAMSGRSLLERTGSGER
jgi:predicted AlkP superfamily phosphohydrolase/phosphomutase